MSDVKYHVNPQGTVGACRAKQQCRFGADTPHFSHPQDAFDNYVANDPELSKLASNVYEGLKAKEKASAKPGFRIPILWRIKLRANEEELKRSKARIDENSAKLNEAAKKFAPESNRVMGFSTAMWESMRNSNGSNQFIDRFAPRLLQNKLGAVEPKPGDPSFIHRRGFGEMNRVLEEAKTVWDDTSISLQREQNAITFGHVKEEDYTEEKKQELQDLRRRNAEAWRTMQSVRAEKDAYEAAVRADNWAVIQLGEEQTVAEMQKDVEAKFTRRTGKKLEDVKVKSVAEMQKDVEAHAARRKAAREAKEAQDS